MTSLLFGLFLQIQSLAAVQSSAPFLCADPSIFHSSVLLSICQTELGGDYSYGVCWSANPNPSIFDAFTIFNNKDSSFEFRVSALKPNTNYFFQFFKMDKSGQVTYYAPFQVETIRELKLGDYYQGGIICYIYKEKDSLYIPWEQHGLIISKEDLGYAQWGMHGRPISDSTGLKVGQGKTNTEKIVKQFRSGASTYFAPSLTATSHVNPCAALLCEDYISDGYDDWFLPSRDEWYKLYLEFEFLPALGINPLVDYWTSSEVYFTWRFNKDKPRHTKYHHKRAWQVRVRAKELIVYTMAPKRYSVLVRAMRYF